MAFRLLDKKFSRKWFLNYSMIVIGSFIMAVGFVYFISPNKIVPGGVFGISIVIHYVTKGLFDFAPEGLPVGVTSLILNIPLTIIGVKILGPKFGTKTVIGFVLSSVFIDLLTYFQGDKALVENDVLLSSIFGGVLVGLGLGLIFRAKATSGGSDIIAMIFGKYTKLPIGQLLIYVDSVIVLLGLIAFRDWKIPLYSWVVIFICGKVIDAVIQGVNYDKALFIISDKSDEIRDAVINDLGRGGTMIKGTGMYKGTEKNIIFTVVNRKEVTELQDYVRKVDPNAFLTVIEANEILGEGFKPLVEK
ncbi:MAG: YitT family protein [Bacteroidota bacterium]